MILLFGGTSDSVQMATELARIGKKLTISTATEYGRDIALALDSPEIDVICSRLDANGMKRLAADIGANCIIDATHPFAVEVSKNAMQCAYEMKIPYARYEREKTSDTEGAACFYSFEEAADFLKGTTGNILLAIGSNNMDVFAKKIEMERLYLRVLPTSKVLSKCERLGFSPKNIIGMQGPFSKEMNRIIIRENSIKYMVTKDSGKQGGTVEKIEAARMEGAHIVFIRRKDMDYPIVFGSISDTVEFALGIGKIGE